MGYTILLWVISLEWIIAIPLLLVLVLISWIIGFARYIGRRAIGVKR